MNDNPNDNHEIDEINQPNSQPIEASGASDTPNDSLQTDRIDEAPDAPIQAQPSPATEPANQPESNPPKAPKRPSRVLFFLLIGLLLMAATAAGTWYVMTEFVDKKVADKPTTLPAANNQPKLLTADETIAKIKTALTEKYAASNPELVFADDVDANGARVPDVPTEVNGAGYFVAPKNYSALEIAGQSGYVEGGNIAAALAEATQQDIAGVLKDNHYTEANKSKTEISNTVEYSSKDVTCGVLALKLSEDDKGLTRIIISCATKAELSKASQNVAPFAKALLDGTKGNDTQKPYFATSEPIIKNSTVKGYRTTSLAVSSAVNIGGYVALFWQKDGGNWQYFTGTQNILGCERYDSADLRAAYADTGCFDKTTQKELKLSEYTEKNS